MIRRWSHINNFNAIFFNFKKIDKFFKIFIFKNTVNYKRFTFKITKFKRKPLVRIKHKSILLIYTNIIKSWSKDYIFNKHCARFQFYNGIHSNHFYFYNFNFIKNRNEHYFYNFNFIFVTFSKKAYFYFNVNPYPLISYSSLTLAWFNDKPFIEKSVIPVYQIRDNDLTIWSQDFKKHVYLTYFFESFYFTFLQKSAEINKILIILFFLNTNLETLIFFVFKFKSI